VNRTRRRLLNLALATAALPVLTGIAGAQTYPARPVRIIVGFAAGGGVDIVARLMGQWLAEQLGQPFTVENRPGANGNIGTETVIRSAADGYTLLLVNAANAGSAALYGNLSFNFIRDIAPVGAIIRVPQIVVVNPLLPSKTIAEFIAYSKANPGKINMASGGNGAPEHMAGELFKLMTGANMLHVPYRGAAPALTDLLAGQVQVMFAAMPASIEHIRAGRLRALAVTTATRAEALPDVPTVGDFVSGYEASQWYGVGAPRGTPSAAVDRLSRAINAGLADPRMRARFAELGGVVLPGSPADFGKIIVDESEKWGKVIRTANIKAE
jgi:tripartite-type tricarboxylate transporter receptor subunit TctC